MAAGENVSGIVLAQSFLRAPEFFSLISCFKRRRGLIFFATGDKVTAR
jgi:hypothetical protein